MAWKNLHKDPQQRDSYQFGDCPYGAYWEEVPDSEVPAALVIELGNIDNLEKNLKAIGLLMRDYCNQLKANTYVNKSVADLKTDFADKYNSLP